MARAPNAFKQRDITRAVKGAFAAGAESVRVELDNGGRIIVIAGKTGAEPPIAAETPDDVKRLL